MSKSQVLHRIRFSDETESREKKILVVLVALVGEGGQYYHGRVGGRGNDPPRVQKRWGDTSHEEPEECWRMGERTRAGRPSA